MATPSRAVSEAPRPGAEARARDELRLALARRDLLTADMAAAARAVTAADERRWDKQAEIERLERAERGDAPDGRAEEADLIAAVMEDRPMPAAEARPSAEALERLRAEAEALQRAAAKLKAKLPERREQIPYAENAVRAAMKAVVGSSVAVAKLLDEAEALRDELVRRRAALGGIIDFLPDGSAAVARAAMLLQPVRFQVGDGETDRWRLACERLSVDADAALPVMEEPRP